MRKKTALPRAAFHQTLLFKIVVVAPLALLGFWLLPSTSRERISVPSRRLLEAVKTNNLMAAATALESYADPNVIADGSTPLILAMRQDALGMVKLLIDRGADVNLASSDGLTPLTLAIHLDQPQFARLLLDAGARCDSPGGAKSAEMHELLTASSSPPSSIRR